MADPKNFVDLQAGFYNALAQGLGYSNQDPFQVIQPSPPLLDGEGADDLLWAYFNNLPVASLTGNTQISGGNQFLANYQAVMSALQSAPNNFQSTLGPACWDSYQAALKQDKSLTNPKKFRNWALYNGACSAVAVSGASALAAAELDPIFAAQLNVEPYLPAGDESVDFVPGYSKMLALLKKAPYRSFNVGTNSWQTDVSSTWTQGSNSGFFGLWGGSSYTSTLSQKFASGGVSVDASFRNVLPFNVTPGTWYSSGAFGLAFNNPGSAPWKPGVKPNWETTFGASGNMQRFASTLVIVNEMNIKVTSNASYSESEQEQIRNNSSAGLWPFYCSSSSGGSNTSTAFNAAGNMTVTITSQKNVPVVIGCIVLSASHYLGHESLASKILTEKFYS
ncbi:hypothetical protein CFB40_26545 [Burkholderia sp. AU31652]|uniref:Uncharacterized protein n=1 Tax=Burkholderia contaminans TaxID=488447 RepID=A0A6P2WCM8_9BURK|nr:MULTISPECIES: hypothetical protein [Burkholderia]MDN7487530.1 hypothetical protein [Burkholderia sp. AU45274]OXI84575.1 hypothetical protein CFB40_26545 [Burkholderia sp. AU31652]OXJ09563.1 hypothetical protein CFB45_21330 [Burkholderia sp. HI2500]VWC96787.1 hypothetical protein BCO71171_01546 [Burkholderia contaminans]